MNHLTIAALQRTQANRARANATRAAPEKRSGADEVIANKGLPPTNHRKEAVND